MSLENEIKLLREALEKHTEVISQINITAKSTIEETEQEKPKETPKKKPAAKKATTKKPVEKQNIQTGEERIDPDEEITAQQMKDLAREKIADGTSRTDIKQIVSDCGGDMIGDLDQAGLTKFRDKLNEL